MTDQQLMLGEVEVARTPAQRRILRVGLAAAVVLDAILLALLVWHPRKAPVPVTMTQVGPISAYVNIAPAPTATSGAPKTTPRKAISLAPAPHAVEPKPTSMETASAAEQPSASNAPQASGPVRLNPGQVTLIKKVEPVYPPIMLAAGVKGTVVLDAVIHADGTIGDVTLVQSSSSAFNDAAIAAVKQWRYSPPGFEAVVNVTVIFSIR